MRVSRARAGSIAAVATIGAMGLLVLAAGTAPAGNRDALSTIAGFPGLTVVTAGQNWAVTASLENREKSAFSDVRFRLPIPAGWTFVATDCSKYQIVAGNPAEFVCNWGKQLGAGATATVAVVLRTFAGGSSANLAGSWVVKSKGGGSDSFPTNVLSVPLVSADDPQQAGTFATSPCGTTSMPTIATHQVLASGNPLATSVCAPNLPTVPVTGIVSTINERNHQATDPGVSQVSNICLPAPGAACGETPFHFSTPATFTFLIDNTALPPVCGEKGSCKLRRITKVFHDGVLVPFKPASADPRVVSITFSSETKTTTVVVKSSENGDWDFG